MSDTVYLGRQPILDRQRRTFGYELLYRSAASDGALFSNQDDATRVVIERALLEWGLEHVLHGRTGFVNVGAGFLRSGMYQALPADQVILELLEDIEFDAEMLALVTAARHHGYRLALDDVIDVGQLGTTGVLRLADIVKVDVLAVDPDHLPALVAELRAAAPGAALLAEKVEEPADFHRCLALGFDLFQGYFFAKPELLARAARPVNSTAAMALIVEVQQPEVSIPRLEELVTGDPTLAFRLLALVNSSLSGVVSRISSVQQAIVLLGIEQVRQIATLITMAATSRTNPEIVTLGATRARMARALVSDAALEGAAFTVGLLSVIDVIFDSPMEELLTELPLTAEVAAGLRGAPGPLGDVLAAIRAYERADLAALEVLRPGGWDALLAAYGEATSWADQFTLQFST